MRNFVKYLSIAAILVVIGMLITGCASLAEMLNPPPPPTDDGIGGIVIIRVTNNETYWYVGYTGDDDDGVGLYISRNEPVTAYAVTSSYPPQRTLRNDTKFTVRYRLARKSELEHVYGTSPEVKREDKRSWYRKTVFVSNDETVEITIP